MTEELSPSNFETNINRRSLFQCIQCSLLFFLNIYLSTGFFFNLTTKDIFFLLLITLTLMAFFQILVIPKTNRVLMKDIIEALDKNTKGILEKAERTQLVQQIMELPAAMAVKVALSFFIGSSIPAFMLISKYSLSKFASLYVTAFVLMGIFYCGILAYCTTEFISSKYAEKIITQGIDGEYIKKHKFFGLSITTRIALMCILPILVTTLDIVFFILMVYSDRWAQNIVLSKATYIIISTTVLSLLSIIFFNWTIHSSSIKVNAILEQINYYKEKELYLPTDLGWEPTFNIFLIDELISKLQSISKDAAQTGENIVASTRNLSIASKQTAQTSISEATAIKKCLVTIENAKDQHNIISSTISKIQDLAEITKFNSDLGGELLEQGIDKMEEIADANLETIYGIRRLSEKVDQVWKLINQIDKISEKTRTIALNAEIVSTVTEGASSEKIHIIANEIQRLANTISSSTKDVKNKISRIQHSTDNLIITSEAGTQKTREGSKFYYTLEENFNALVLSSEVTAESIRRIFEITEIQKDAFAQINDTLREINTGFEKFSQAAQKISTEAEQLRKSAITMGFSEEQEGGK